MDNFNEDMLAANTKEAIDILGRKWQYKCMSCAIANGELELPGGLIYEDEYITVGADTEIPLNGFIIIAVKRHVNSIADLTVTERHELIDYISKIIQELKELNIINEVTIVQEERSKHLHVWIFPCYKKYKKMFGKGVGAIKNICEYVKLNSTSENVKQCLNTVQKLKEYFKEI